MDEIGSAGRAFGAGSAEGTVLFGQQVGDEPGTEKYHHRPDQHRQRRPGNVRVPVRLDEKLVEIDHKGRADIDAQRTFGKILHPWAAFCVTRKIAHEIENTDSQQQFAVAVERLHHGRRLVIFCGRIYNLSATNNNGPIDRSSGKMGLSKI